MAREKNLRFTRSIARSILDNSFSTSAWIFTTLIGIGEITVQSFLAPSYYANLPEPIDLFADQKEKKLNVKEITIRQSIRRLQKQGFVKKDQNRYVLTKLGKKLAEYVMNRKNIIDAKWDKKYRVVIFDIPEEQKKIRDWFRQELGLLSYRSLQKSVFVSKFPLTSDLIKEIKRKKIGNCVNYLLVDKVYKNIL